MVNIFHYHLNRTRNLSQSECYIFSQGGRSLKLNCQSYLAGAEKLHSQGLSFIQPSGKDAALPALSKSLSNCERSQLPEAMLLGGAIKRLTKNLKGKIGNGMHMEF